MKILITSGHLVNQTMYGNDGTGPAIDIIRNAGIEIVHFPKPKYNYTLEELKAIMPGVGAVIVGVDPWGAAQMDVSPDLKGVCRFGVGFDSVNLDDARARGITVTNTRVIELSQSVAEAAMAITLAVVRKVVPAGSALHEGKWSYPVTGFLIRGKTVGIIGFGAIGRCYAEYMQGFGVRLLAYDPYPNHEEAKRLNVTFRSFDEVLAESDIVNLSAPNTAENRNLFNKERFSKMKQGSVFVNTARGGMVDEQALYDALTQGPLAAAGIDVWQQEPTSPDNPLLKLENLLPLPHMASDTGEANLAIAKCAAQQAVDICMGRKPINIVS